MNEIWMLTVNGAFQRAKVYKNGTSEKDKNLFKRKLKNFICELSNSYHANPIDDNTHIENIHSVMLFSKEFGSLLNSGFLNFGISQKILNLYLKYLWCLGMCEVAPPHFPVDRIIQGKLKISSITSWTQMVNENEYIKIIQVARNCLTKSDCSSIAELELHLFNRKGN